MKFDVSFNAENQLAEIITYGIMDTTNSMEMAKAIFTALDQYKAYKILIDQRNIESVSGTISEIYSRPKEFKEIGVIQQVKIAEIIKHEHEKHFKFLELVLVNRGFNISLFFEKETALEWLFK
jgi:hypothetical protein